MHFAQGSQYARLRELQRFYPRARCADKERMTVRKYVTRDRDTFVRTPRK
jgi:hypothetical protein